MAKRGRKPGSTKKKGYFQIEQEDAVKEYISATTKSERDKIFKEKLQGPFTTMIESIIRRYNLYVPDEYFDETFADTMSFLMTKIEKFNPDSGYKAYSYAGTIVKNYLIYKINQFSKRQTRNTSYDDDGNMEVNNLGISDNLKYSYSSDSSSVAFLTELMKKTASEINEMINRTGEHEMKQNEKLVGSALVEALTNWEDIFSTDGSNKLNKSSVLYFLREATCMSTKEVRDSMKAFKEQYYNIKRIMTEEG
jgi:hypothetical protein